MNLLKSITQKDVSSFDHPFKQSNVKRINFVIRHWKEGELTFSSEEHTDFYAHIDFNDQFGCEGTKKIKANSLSSLIKQVEMFIKTLEK